MVMMEGVERTTTQTSSPKPTTTREQTTTPSPKGDEGKGVFTTSAGHIDD